MADNGMTKEFLISLKADKKSFDNFQKMLEQMVVTTKKMSKSEFDDMFKDFKTSFDNVVDNILNNDKLRGVDYTKRLAKAMQSMQDPMSLDDPQAFMKSIIQWSKDMDALSEVITRVTGGNLKYIDDSTLRTITQQANRAIEARDKALANSDKQIGVIDNYRGTYDITGGRKKIINENKGSDEYKTSIQNTRYIDNIGKIFGVEDKELLDKYQKDIAAYKSLRSKLGISKNGNYIDYNKLTDTDEYKALTTTQQRISYIVKAFSKLAEDFQKFTFIAGDIRSIEQQFPNLKNNSATNEDISTLFSKDSKEWAKLNGQNSLQMNTQIRTSLESFIQKIIKQTFDEQIEQIGKTINENAQQNIITANEKRVKNQQNYNARYDKHENTEQQYSSLPPDEEIISTKSAEEINKTTNALDKYIVSLDDARKAVVTLKEVDEQLSAVNQDIWDSDPEKYNTMVRKLEQTLVYYRAVFAKFDKTREFNDMVNRFNLTGANTIRDIVTENSGIEDEARIEAYNQIKNSSSTMLTTVDDQYLQALRTSIIGVGDITKQTVAQTDDMAQSVNSISSESVDKLLTSFKSLSSQLDVIINQIDTVFGTINGYQKVMYHTGDIWGYTPTGRKDDAFADMLNDDKIRSGYRGLGYFGTGIYGSENANDVVNNAHGKDVYAIDISKYNLYQNKTPEQAEKLLSFLQDLQQFTIQMAGIKIPDWSEKLKNVDVKNLYERAKELFGDFENGYEDIQDFIKQYAEKVKETYKEVGFGQYEYDYDNPVSRDKQNDVSISTAFMKMLGYQGVSNIGVKGYNGFTHGTVLYDYDRNENPPVAEFSNADRAQLVDYDVSNRAKQYSLTDIQSGIDQIISRLSDIYSVVNNDKTNDVNNSEKFNEIKTSIDSVKQSIDKCCEIKSEENQITKQSNNIVQPANENHIAPEKTEIDQSEMFSKWANDAGGINEITNELKGTIKYIFENFASNINPNTSKNLKTLYDNIDYTPNFLDDIVKKGFQKTFAKSGEINSESALDFGKYIQRFIKSKIKDINWNDKNLFGGDKSLIAKQIANIFDYYKDEYANWYREQIQTMQNGEEAIQETSVQFNDLNYDANQIAQAIQQLKELSSAITDFNKIHIDSAIVDIEVFKKSIIDQLNNIKIPVNVIAQVTPNISEGVSSESSRASFDINNNENNYHEYTAFDALIDQIEADKIIEKQTESKRIHDTRAKKAILQSTSGNNLGMNNSEIYVSVGNNGWHDAYADRREHGFMASSKYGIMTNPYLIGSGESVPAELTNAAMNEIAKKYNIREGKNAFDLDFHTHPEKLASFSWYHENDDGSIEASGDIKRYLQMKNTKKAIVASTDEVAELNLTKETRPIIKKALADSLKYISQAGQKEQIDASKEIMKRFSVYTPEKLLNNFNNYPMKDSRLYNGRMEFSNILSNLGLSEKDVSRLSNENRFGTLINNILDNAIKNIGRDTKFSGIDELTSTLYKEMSNGILNELKSYDIDKSKISSSTFDGIFKKMFGNIQDGIFSSINIYDAFQVWTRDIFRQKIAENGGDPDEIYPIFDIETYKRDHNYRSITDKGTVIGNNGVVSEESIKLNIDKEDLRNQISDALSSPIPLNIDTSNDLNTESSSGWNFVSESVNDATNQAIKLEADVLKVNKQVKKSIPNYSTEQIQAESAQLAKLAEELQFVQNAIKEKTLLFEQEGVTVDNVVSGELQMLNTLVNQLHEVSNAVQPLIDEFIKLSEINIDNIDGAKAKESDSDNKDKDDNTDSKTKKLKDQEKAVEDLIKAYEKYYDIQYKFVTGDADQIAVDKSTDELNKAKDKYNKFVEDKSVTIENSQKVKKAQEDYEDKFNQNKTTYENNELQKTEYKELKDMYSQLDDLHDKVIRNEGDINDIIGQRQKLLDNIQKKREEINELGLKDEDTEEQINKNYQNSLANIGKQIASMSGSYADRRMREATGKSITANQASADALYNRLMAEYNGIIQNEMSSEQRQAVEGNQIASKRNAINKIVADLNEKADKASLKIGAEGGQYAPDSNFAKSYKNVRDIIGQITNAVADANDNIDKLYKGPDKENLIKMIRQATEELNKMGVSATNAGGKVASALDISNAQTDISTFINNNSKVLFTRFRKQFKELQDEANTMVEGVTKAEQIDAFNNKLNTLKSRVQSAGLTGQSVLSNIDSMMQSTISQAIAGIGTIDIASKFREAYQEAVNLNTQMVELSKVSNTSLKDLNANFEQYKNIAKNIGGTIEDAISATADWSRNGYNLPDAQELARVAMLYKNVGDGITIDEANASLISTLQGFKMKPEEASKIVDVINSVSNNEPISSGGIGQALQRSSASFSTANTSLEGSVALITAANSVVQDPERVGKIIADIKNSCIG